MNQTPSPREFKLTEKQEALKRLGFWNDAKEKEAREAFERENSLPFDDSVGVDDYVSAPIDAYDDAEYVTDADIDEHGNEDIEDLITNSFTPDSKEKAMQRLGVDPSNLPRPPKRGVVEEHLEEASPIDISCKLSHVPEGLVRDIAQWILDSSFIPQAELSVAAALLVVGTAAGRKYVGPTNAHTNLYFLGIAGTGTGKDHIFRSVSQILRKARLEDHVGAQFGSAAGFLELVKQKPLHVTCIDEFGGFLKTIMGNKVATHNVAVSSMMRTLWSSSAHEYRSHVLKDSPSIRISNPCVSLLGISTEREFYEAIGGSGSIEDGLLNRFTIVKGDNDARKRTEPLVDASIVPREILTGLTNIYFEMGNFNPNEIVKRNNRENDIVDDGKVVRVEWADKETRERYNAFSDRIGKILKRDTVISKLYGRVAEMAIRIATIVSISRGSAFPEVTMEDMNFGIYLAERSAKMMAGDASDHISDNEFESQLKKVLLSIKGMKGDDEGWVWSYDISRNNRIKDFKLIMGRLLEEDFIEASSIKNPRGKPTVKYRLIKDEF